ncbi:hypothetical protein [Photobacterium leiognathi]|uniref:hypothetical protein n=1 Tax=Photobacterium leiognathi TaxID=553611 RepID=UPI0029811756|nr:hypothetical protein [Photobacterium leiognathi]
MAKKDFKNYYHVSTNKKNKFDMLSPVSAKGLGMARYGQGLYLGDAGYDREALIYSFGEGLPDENQLIDEQGEVYELSEFATALLSGDKFDDRLDGLSVPILYLHTVSVDDELSFYSPDHYFTEGDIPSDKVVDLFVDGKVKPELKVDYETTKARLGDLFDQYSDYIAYDVVDDILTEAILDNIGTNDGNFSGFSSLEDLVFDINDSIDSEQEDRPDEMYPSKITVDDITGLISSSLNVVDLDYLWIRTLKDIIDDIALSPDVGIDFMKSIGIKGYACEHSGEYLLFDGRMADVDRIEVAKSIPVKELSDYQFEQLLAGVRVPSASMSSRLQNLQDRREADSSSRLQSTRVN